MNILFLKKLLISITSLLVLGLAFGGFAQPAFAQKESVRQTYSGQQVLLKNSTYFHFRQKFEIMNIDYVSYGDSPAGLGTVPSYGDFVQPVKVLVVVNNYNILVESSTGQQMSVTIDDLLLPVDSYQTKNGIFKVFRNDPIDVVSESYSFEYRSKYFTFVSGRVLELYEQNIVQLKVDSPDEHHKDVDFFIMHKLTRNLSTKEKLAKKVTRFARQAPIAISATLADLFGTGGYYQWRSLDSKKPCDWALDVSADNRRTLHIRSPRPQFL